MDTETPFLAFGENRKGRLFYLTAGIAVLLPWNVCISTFSKFNYSDWPFTNSAAYTTALLVSQIIGIGQRYAPKSFSWPFASLAIVCLLVPLQIHFTIPAPYDFLLSCTLIVLMAMSSSFSQLVTMERAAIDDQGLVMSIGSGLAGPIAAMYGDRFDGYFVSAAACLVCSYWGDDSLYPEYPLQGKSILPLALHTPMSTTTISTAATTRPVSPSPSEISTAATATTVHSPLSTAEELEPCSSDIYIRKDDTNNRMLKFTLFATYALSFYCFPGKLLNWVPQATAVFQLTDFVGRCTPMFFPLTWKLAPPIALLRLPFLTLVLIPSVVELFTLEIKIMAIGLFAFSNGLITSLILGQSEETGIGAELSLSLIGGLVTGSWLAMLV